ncbi:rex2 [[Candida] subhashii]|uniref:Rex2 n=1 Tax=[Candida] subhashii TaxID=561895 RepID=A0A8J5QLY8_9ASCO|nr:rex2 [[Candida] subhashii]KAG7664044.1 rex2 [[Candida] subhashii]
MSPTSYPKNPLVWIDCEMTGLDVLGTDNIIEIACFITDGDLNIIDPQGYESTIYYPEQRLSQMNEWCISTHAASGLTQRILDHPEQTLEKVQGELLEYIKKYIPKKNVGIMAGNSIHMDKFFMMKEFPRVIEHLHYRLVDVSSISEVGKRHSPRLMKLMPSKKQLHTAKSDILESIEQLKWFREHYLKGGADEVPMDAAREKRRERHEMKKEENRREVIEEMRSLLGKIEEADGKKEDVKLYVEQCNDLLIALDESNKKQKIQ